MIMLNVNAKIRHIYLSEGHNFRGRHGEAPAEHSVRDVPSVQCVAGKGLEGDRYFEHEEGHKGQVTFFEWEVFRDLCRELDVQDRAAFAVRRNVIVEGVELAELVGREFEIQGVTFEGVEECRPCHWMDLALAPGAEAAMAGRGGLRARILSSGVLRKTGID